MTGITILLADDHQILRKGLCALLQERHPALNVVGEADDGRTAVELARKLRPQVVVMDISMPRLNGIDATRMILSEHAGTKVIALSMHPDPHFVVEMFRAGASAYLLKECAAEELQDAITAVVSGASYVSRSIEPSLAGGQAGGDVPWRRLSVFSVLTQREREVMQLLTEGEKIPEIARCLGIGAKTVETHRRHIMKKLGIATIPQLTKYAIQTALSPLGSK